MTPYVSVIIPTYNCRKYIIDSIESIIAQTIQGVEIIVVDDGSTDDTESALLPYLEKIVYIRQENRGVSAARNTGLSVARGNYVALQDADDLWLPNKLELQLNVLLQNEDIAFVWAGAARLQENILLENTDEYHAKRMHLSLEDFLRYGMTPINTVFFSRRRAIEIGGFDESLHWKEDWDFLVRLAQDKKRYYIPIDLAYYRIHEGQSISNPKMYLSGDCLRAIKKNKHIFYMLSNGRKVFRSVVAAEYIVKAYNTIGQYRFRVFLWILLSFYYEPSGRLVQHIKLAVECLFGPKIYAYIKKLAITMNS